MTTKLTKIAIAAFVSSTALTGLSHAQGFFGSSPAEDSLYVSGFVGAVFPGNADFDGTQAPVAGAPGALGDPAEVFVDFGTDVYFGGAIGYQLPFQFFNTFHPRLEVEVSYFETDVDDGSFNGGDQVFSGDQSSLFILINNYTDIRWSDNQVVIPYIGGGLGVGIIDTNVAYVGAGAPFFPAPAFILQGDNDVGFTTSTALGLTIAANDNFEIYGEGRYLKTYGVDADRNFFGGTDVGLFNAELDDNPDAFTVTGGIRFRF